MTQTPKPKPTPLFRVAFVADRNSYVVEHKDGVRIWPSVMRAADGAAFRDDPHAARRAVELATALNRVYDDAAAALTLQAQLATNTTRRHS